MFLIIRKIYLLLYRTHVIYVSVLLFNSLKFSPFIKAGICNATYEHCNKNVAEGYRFAE